MTKVLKYKLDTVDRQTVEIPGIYKVLSVAVQHNYLVLYVLVNQKLNHVGLVDVIVKETGHNIMHPLVDWNFMGTHVQSDTLVWHVWMNHEIVMKNKKRYLLSP